MNRINLSLALAVLVALSASCAKEIGKLSEPLPESLAPVSFTASGEISTKTVFSAGSVKWEETDKISLFSGTGFTTKTELTIKNISEDCRKAEFEGLAADGSSSYVAVYPSAAVNSYDGSVLTISIPSEQTAVANGFMSGANTTISSSNEKNLIFRNVGALIGICLETADASEVSTIKFRAKKSSTEFAGVSGTASVTLEQNAGIPAVVGDGSSDFITLASPEGGFIAETPYYAVVYPGTYAGFELTLTYLDGSVRTKTVESTYNLDRSSMLTWDLNMVVVPDDFVVTVDFTSGWPFFNTFASDQTTTPETYYYEYSYGANGSKKTYMPFEITAEDYSFTSDGLKFLYAGQFYLPAFKQMYLRSAVVTKAAASRLTFTGQATSGASAFAQTSVTYTVYSDKTIYLDKRFD